MQEWCGHVYAQLNNRDDFEFTSHSYFEGEADQSIHLDKTHLEDELWTKIRVNPKNLPLGEVSMVPSLEFFRLQHQPVKAYKASTALKEENGLFTYVVDYLDTNRKLTLRFSKELPYQIQGWEEEFKSGYGPNAKTFTSKATRSKSLKTPYWRQNRNEDVVLRDSLGL